MGDRTTRAIKIWEKNLLHTVGGNYENLLQYYLISEFRSPPHFTYLRDQGVYPLLRCEEKEICPDGSW